MLFKLLEKLFKKARLQKTKVPSIVPDIEVIHGAPGTTATEEMGTGDAAKVSKLPAKKRGRKKKQKEVEPHISFIKKELIRKRFKKK